MKREDYVKKATARIFDSRQKRAVTAELEDHIAHRTQALEEIGYDPERAEAQGVEAMGDPAEICDQLGALHNRFYTPVWTLCFCCCGADCWPGRILPCGSMCLAMWG